MTTVVPVALKLPIPITPPVSTPIHSKKRQPVWVWVLAFFFGVGTIGVVRDALRSSAEIKADSLAAEQQATKQRVEAMRLNIEKSEKELAQPNASRDLLIKNDSWEKGGFGAVGLHSFTIYNSSKTHKYKDIKVEVSYQGESGTELGSRMQVVYKTVSAGKKVRVNGLNTGFINAQAATASITIVDATSL